MDGMIPTTLSKVNVDDKAPLISSYGTRGFTVRGSTRLTGSVALLPKGYFHWKIKDASEIVPEALTLFTIVQPQLGKAAIVNGTSCNVIL
jgi:NADH dehydrogenase [ubiquinone] 1 alpha subcomplex assembly factor 3